MNRQEIWGLKIIGDVDHSTSVPHIGKIGDHLKGKIVGTKWHDKEVIFRLDWDPIKGNHINITDFRRGKGMKGVSVAIPFEGSKELVTSLCKRLNTKACLETAKSIFEKNEKYVEDLELIIKALNEG
jgi:hypothetical protein